MKSLFEQMGGTYRQECDYLIPNLVLYTNLVVEGTLFEHLAEIYRSCNTRMGTIVSAMAKQNIVPSDLHTALR